MDQISRKLAPKVIEALGFSPVVFVNGARQAGKSTMVQGLAQKEFPAEYVTFDSPTQMAAASSSPYEYLTSRQLPLIIDEVQLAPEIFRALKRVVDELRLSDKANANGSFLLTGSSNIMALPKLSDPLVGRMSVMSLYPLAACEAFGGKGDFLESLFMSNFLNSKPQKRTINEAISHATFPEISGKPSAEHSAWFEGYITTMLQRDIRMFAKIEKVAQLPNLLRVLAARSGSLMNDASIARDVGLTSVTTRTYRSILQAMFMTLSVPPWYRNITKRLVKSPKGYLTDTLMLCHLGDWNLEDLRMRRPDLFGHVVENFVASELTKLLSFSKISAKLLHFRTSDDKEVDFILERPNGTLAAIEVKTRDAVDSDDFKGIKELQSLVGDDLVCGIVLYQGDTVVPFGKNLLAVPLSYLWQ